MYGILLLQGGTYMYKYEANIVEKEIERYIKQKGIMVS